MYSFDPYCFGRQTIAVIHRQDLSWGDSSSDGIEAKSLVTEI